MISISYPDLLFAAANAFKLSSQSIVLYMRFLFSMLHLNIRVAAATFMPFADYKWFFWHPSLRLESHCWYFSSAIWGLFFHMGGSNQLELHNPGPAFFLFKNQTWDFSGQYQASRNDWCTLASKRGIPFHKGHAPRHGWKPLNLSALLGTQILMWKRMLTYNFRCLCLHHPGCPKIIGITTLFQVFCFPSVEMSRWTVLFIHFPVVAHVWQKSLMPWQSVTRPKKRAITHPSPTWDLCLCVSQKP